jgi:hypothetical protein
MILANTRDRLSREDAQLVVRLVARGSGGALDEAEGTLNDRVIADYVASIPRHFSVRQRSRQLGDHDDATTASPTSTGWPRCSPPPPNGSPTCGWHSIG